MAHAHHHEEALRPIHSLPRSLVILLVEPVLPVDLNFLEIAQITYLTRLLKPSILYSAVSLHPRVEQVAVVPCFAHHVIMPDRHLIFIADPSGANRARGDVRVLGVFDPR